MEMVLGIDNLIFVAILSNSLPEDQAARAPDWHRPCPGHAPRLAFSDRVAGRAHDSGIRSRMRGSPDITASPLSRPNFPGATSSLSPEDCSLCGRRRRKSTTTSIPIRAPVCSTCERHADVGSAIAQIVLLDLVFSIDSILTAVGMTDQFRSWCCGGDCGTGNAFGRRPAGELHSSQSHCRDAGLGFLLIIGAVLSQMVSASMCRRVTSTCDGLLRSGRMPESVVEANTRCSRRTGGHKIGQWTRAGCS